MQIDWHPFPINKLDLENPAVLIQPEQADTTEGKNVIIGESRSERDVKLTPSCEVMMEKLFDGEETITITIKGSTTGSRAGKAEGSTSARNDGKREPNTTNQRQAVRPPPS
jgi:hypothetical protein